MTSHGIVIPNTTAPEVRLGINNALQDVQSNNFGATSPADGSSPEGTMWYDTGSNSLKIKLGTKYYTLF
ncbi:hypothetical protein, partial [Oenococcus oeni]|uniref:hypothetical protein n=1 Tax=Oenococcus oeni TaxID=1247 RepID=UPI00117FF8C3